MPGGKLQIWISMFSYFENRKTTYFDFLSLNFTVEMKIKTLFLIFQFIKKNEMALWVHGFFTYCPVNHEYSWKKIQIEKKSEFCFRTCKNRLSVCDGWRASWLFQWRRSLSYRNQTIDFQNKSVDWFLYDRGIRHERVHPLLLTFIHQDILLDYDKLCIWHLRI